ncbi:hypothetical protein GCM10010103_79040 [Streptomyces paradoxus]
MSTYVYGITYTSHPSLPKEVDGVGDPPRPVRVLRQGELAATVFGCPEGVAEEPLGRRDATLLRVRPVRPREMESRRAG